MKKILLAVSTLALTILPLLAQDPPDPVFKAKELSLDVFGGYKTRQQAPESKTGLAALVERFGKA